MLFNSPAFVVFFVVVFSLYWLRRDRVSQNALLLVASYIFYGMWSWKFLLLLVASSAVDYLCGIMIESEAGQRRRRVWLMLSIVSNLSILAGFKYLGFFVNETVTLLQSLGLRANTPMLEILLPIGISFYTFQSMGYVIDVYRSKVGASRNPLEYALYIAFFPQLVAGPIERAGHMLPQFGSERHWNSDMFETGLLLMVWGLFKKVMIADNLAPYVDIVFAQPQGYSGVAVSTAVVFFAFQIYCDFSGYTDVARGAAKTLGFELTRNFDHPYISRNPVEFWRRWHISLSLWFQDYLYFPLAMHYMRIGGWASKYKAHIVAMGLIGFWHGANWTFIVFGLYWGLAIAAYLYLVERAAQMDASSHPSRVAAMFAPISGSLSIALMFLIVCAGWVLFRANNIEGAVEVFSRVLASEGASVVASNVIQEPLLWLLIAGLLGVEWIQRNVGATLESLARPGGVTMQVVRGGLLAATLFAYLSMQRGASQPFIYFQF